ncbi:MAG: DUF87 domain-containing protein [Caldilineaceae bacterium]
MGQFLPKLLSWIVGTKQQTLTIGVKGPFGLVPVTISLDDFNTHLYVVGQSGQGKSKFLQQLLYQLASTEWGSGVFDPHSDLANDLLAQLASYPSHHPWLADPANQKRIIYLDPSRTDYLIPANILKSSSSTPYETAENVVEAFRRVWPETLTEAPRFAQIMRNALTVLAMCGLSLLELEPLLTDGALRKRLLLRVNDPLIVAFFEQQYDRWGREQALFISPVLNKVSAFLFKPQVRALLGANANALDFPRILDEGKILIVNLGGFRDEETARLLGSLWLTSLEQAAFARSPQPARARKPCLYVLDEFALWCAREQTGLARILSECRKYRLHLALAGQTTAQTGPRIQGALENAKLKVIFSTGRQTAEALVSDLFLPNPKTIKHEVSDPTAQTRSHPLYSGLQEQTEHFIQTIQRLQQRQVLLRLPDSNTVHHLRTLTVPQPRITPTQLEQWKIFLVRQVGQPRQVLEGEIIQRSQQLGIMSPSTLDPKPRVAPTLELTPDAFWL